MRTFVQNYWKIRANSATHPEPSTRSPSHKGHMPQPWDQVVSQNLSPQCLGNSNEELKEDKASICATLWALTSILGNRASSSHESSCEAARLKVPPYFALGRFAEVYTVRYPKFAARLKNRRKETMRWTRREKQCGKPTSSGGHSFHRFRVTTSEETQSRPPKTGI